MATIQAPEKPLKVELVCPSEKQIIGEIPVNPQGDLSTITVRRSIRFRDKWKPKGDYLDRLQDGITLPCPRCFSFLNLKHPGASVEDALKENLRLTLGHSRFAGSKP